MPLFYDIEVFPYYWCAVVTDDHDDENCQEIDRFVFEDVESLRSFYKEHRKEFTWVGYNSRQYDAPMLRFIMLGLDPYQCSHDLIVVGKKWFEFGFRVTEAYKRIPLKNFDCMLPNKGLKKLEAFRGSSIVETSVPFDTDRPLTREEKDEVIKYCTHDVLETRKVFYDNKEEYDAHESLIKTFNLPPEFFNKTKAQLAAVILGAVKTPRFDEWEFEIPDTLDIEKYAYIVDWYKDRNNHNYSKKLNVEVAGVPHVFAWGGLHGARPHYSGTGYYVNMDVRSYYPALMIEYGYLSRNVQDPEKFRQMRDERLVFKKNKDPRQYPYKIVINGTFGAQKDKFNALYDPRQANSVCVGGQLLLLDLIEHLEGHCEIIQSNTDGILVKLFEKDDYDKIVAIGQEWSKRTQMELEYDQYHKVFQKDVNNYVIVPEEKYHEDGKPAWKTKGAYVKELSNSDYDLPIVNKAIVNYLVHGKPIEETVNESTSLIDFQKIVMVSSLYKYALHGFPKKVEYRVHGDKAIRWEIGDDCQILNEKHLRVFASTNPEDGGIYKVHAKRENVNKVGDTPDHAFLVNGWMDEQDINDYPLDRQYYIDMANKRVKGFLTKSA